MGRLLVGAPDCWPTMSGISSDGKEVEDIFRCLAEIRLKHDVKHSVDVRVPGSAASIKFNPAVYLVHT